MLAHDSVLLNEVVASLAIKPAGYYIDATFGRGGHSKVVLSQLNDKGRLMIIDKDPVAVAYASHCFQNDARVCICHGPFTQLDEWVKTHWSGKKVNGVLFDLGVSSPQLEDPVRGFSFMHDGPLDMRMDNTQGESAADWLATASCDHIADVLRTYGEERYAKRIANAIVEKRAIAPITRTSELVNIIVEASPIRERHKHPATRSFQAIRIYLNNELSELEIALAKAVDALAELGRLAVISFHSLEDRIVKQFIKQHTRPKPIPRGMPIRGVDDAHVDLRTCTKAIKPSVNERTRNPRSRSAILRVVEKIK